MISPLISPRHLVSTHEVCCIFGRQHGPANQTNFESNACGLLLSPGQNVNPKHTRGDCDQSVPQKETRRFSVVNTEIQRGVFIASQNDYFDRNGLEYPGQKKTRSNIGRKDVVLQVSFSGLFVLHKYPPARLQGDESSP